MLMEQVVSRQNMWAAYQRVVRNKGAAGVDGMTDDQLGDFCKAHWQGVREQLLGGTYRPQAVRQVEIPKPGGGVRTLGIPTVLDRLIQQALHQVLCPIFDPTFSQHSYGFRPGRSTHQAVKAARDHIAAGCRWVVDMDLEKFFDRVNHDVLMARVARKVTDTRVLALIGRYLRAGLMDGGVVSQRTEGTPQGGPLSPLLSNIMLDDLDKELERRGHAFVRYADDCTIYVRSRAAGERVLASLTRFLSQRLRLTVNAAKSAVDRPWKRTFLGYTMTHHHAPRLKVAGTSVKRFKAALRDVFRRGRGRSIGRLIDELTPKLRGWMAYFRLAQVKGTFEELDRWLRRKLRVVLWRQWKRPRTRAHKLMQRGLAPDRAWLSALNGRGPWWNAGARHMNQAVPTSFLRSLGLTPFIDHWHRLQRSA
jgi:group II intron reverse transcriptase/maturase